MIVKDIDAKREILEHFSMYEVSIFINQVIQMQLAEMRHLRYKIVELDQRLSQPQYEEMWKYFFVDKPDHFRVAKNMVTSTYKKWDRVHKKIQSLIKANRKYTVFLTFTFTNDSLEQTTQQQRRKEMTRFLTEFTDDYVANIDFGDDNGREHYHAVVSSDSKIPYTFWKYGNLDGEKILHSLSHLRLSDYITKLTYHALKLDDNQQNLIYPRKKSRRRRSPVDLVGTSKLANTKE